MILLVFVIGLRSDYVISDTDVLFSEKQTKILTVRTCLVVGGRNVTNNRLLCGEILVVPKEQIPEGIDHR